MPDAIDVEFLSVPTPLEYGTWKVHEVMPQTIGAMNSILARFSTLSLEVFYKIYNQWCKLDQLQIEGEIAMFDGFCEATKNILARPMEVSDIKWFILMIILIEDLGRLQPSSEVMTQFQRYLPRISQETINVARDVWKKQIMHSSLGPNSVFFSWREDIHSRYSDLDYLQFFYERASDDSELNEWYRKFGKYCRS